MKNNPLSRILSSPEFQEIIEAVGKGISAPTKAKSRSGIILVSEDIEIVAHNIPKQLTVKP